MIERKGEAFEEDGVFGGGAGISSNDVSELKEDMDLQ